MRLATVKSADGARVVIATADGLLDVAATASRLRPGSEWERASLRGLVAGGLDKGEPARTLLEELLGNAAGGGTYLDADAVQFLPPVLDPPRVFCVGRNYEEHAREGNAEVPDFPMIFLKPATALVGHDQFIEIPSSTEKVDWEGEVAVVIGRPGRDIAEADAWNHIAGYTIANDVTARDWQRRTSQFDAGKMFDSFGPMGPFLVTADEVADPGALTIVTRVNGEVMQSGQVEEMIFSIPHLVSYLSAAVRLLPGDVIMTGTPSGVGYARTPPVFLSAGDVVEIAVDGLGELRSRVVALAPSDLGELAGA